MRRSAVSRVMASACSRQARASPQPPLLEMQPAEVAERVALEDAVADLAVNRERRLVQRARLVEPTQVLVQAARGC